MSGPQETSPLPGPSSDPELGSRERQDILDHIDDLVAGARKPVTGAQLAYRAGKSGAIFPLLVNLGAVALIGAGVYFLPPLFDRREQSIIEGAVELPSGEAGIVSAVRREGEEKLADKDREIVGIQSKIEGLGRELLGLRTGRDTEIARREQALRDAIAAELAAERQRLEKAGASATSLEKQLAALDQRRSTELAQQLDAYRKQKDAEVAAKEKEIDTRFASFQRDLATARRERLLLEGEFAATAASGAAATSEQERLARELAAVTEQSRREALAVDQLTTAWQSVGEAMSAGQWEQALLGLDGVEGLLAQQSFAALPAIQRRAAVDGFLAQSMRRLVAADRGNPDTGSAAAAAREASSLVVQAEAELADGDVKAARELYLAAIGKVPALQTAYERLAGMDAGGSASSRQAVADAVAEADAAYAASNWKAALDRYGKALSLLRDTAKNLPRAATRIADAGYRQATDEQATRQDRSARTLVEKADGLLRRGDLDEALVTYASVVDSYPLSAQVKNAVAGISTVVDAKIAAKEKEIASLGQDLAGARAERAAALADAAAKDKVAADALAREKARQDADAKAVAAAQEKMKTLGDGLSTAARRGSQAADAARKELITLLKAKVLVKEALNADAVKAAHPDLNASLDRYIELYGEQERGEGSAAALADVAAVSDFLLGKKTANDLAAVWARYAEETQRSAFQQVLDRLKSLVP
jgi:hypothetical protein